jgi:hypothetical protein
VTYQCDHFYRYSAVAPSTGAHGFLALPYLNSRAFQVWLDGLAAAFPDAINVLGLDNGAGHKATAVRWPVNVMPVCLPPSSPALHPIARLWRDRKDKRSDIPGKTLEALSAAMGAIIQHSSHATLQSLTSFAYFVHAVEAVQKALYGSLPIRNRITPVRK